MDGQIYSGSGLKRLRQSGNRWISGLLPFLVYLVLAFAFFGTTKSWTRWVFGNGPDPIQFVWFLQWFPFAISHGLNPFISHYVWSPAGANLTWDTAIPAAALFMLPVTLLGGAVLSFNILTVLAPALSAWTAFLLARYLTRDWNAALIGGYLFGFSSYEIGQLMGHLNLDLLFLVPVAVLLCIKNVEGTISRGRFIAGLIAVFLTEFFLSTELVASLCFFGAIAWIVFFATVPTVERPGLLRLAGNIALAGLVTMLLALPFVFYLVAGFKTLPSEINSSVGFSADALNFLIPTPVTLIGGAAFASLTGAFAGNSSEQGAYIGLPVALIMVLYFRDHLFRPHIRALLIVLISTVLCSLGPFLHVAGAQTQIGLPWRYIQQVPLISAALPVRLTMYVALLSAIIAALWLASPERRPLRFAFAGIACLSLIPNPRQFKGFPWPTQPFFTPQNVNSELGKHRNVLILPFGAAGNSMAWQVNAGMQFTQSGGYTGFSPEPDGSFAIINQFLTDVPTSSFANDISAFCATHRVDDILIGPGTPAALSAAVNALNWPEEWDSGVEVVKVPAPRTLKYYFIIGDYWPSASALNWMGRRVRVVTQGFPETVIIEAKLFPFKSPIQLKVTSVSGTSIYTIRQSTILMLHFQPGTDATLTASQTFVPAKVLHNDDNRKLSVLISFTPGVKQ